MSSNSRGLLRAALRGLAAPDPGTDAELLARYLADRDEAAFAALVRRHGPMVQAVCRRRLGATADADDAFQVTFMVLARDAAKIASRESLPGWLFRVATLVALKVAGKLGRDRADPLPDEPTESRSPDPAADASARELRDALEREVSALPDRLRAVVVLCGIEERTNAEAAAILGCPTGTVDSRLSAARARLRDRLARRGLAVGSLGALDALLKPAGAAAGIVSADLIETTCRAAVAYAAGRALPDSLTALANGVSPTMSTLNAKLLVAAGMSLALFGGAGLGLYHVGAQDRTQPPLAGKKADPQKKPDPSPSEGPVPDRPAGKPGSVTGPKDEAAVRAILDQPPRIQGVENLDLQTFLGQVTAQTGLHVWIDVAAFIRMEAVGGSPADPEFRASDVKLNRLLGDMSALSLGDLLTQVLAVSLPNATYRVQGNQVVIVPAYRSTSLPVPTEDVVVQPAIPYGRALEQAAGPPVSLGVREQPLPAVIETLRKRTGANIILDTRAASAREPVTASFDDVRLLTVLTVLADAADLEVVALDNVFYLTTPEKAASLRDRIKRNAVGDSPVPAVPAGYVTDGVHLYEKPGNLKPAPGVGGTVPGFVPGPAPAPKPAEKSADKK